LSIREEGLLQRQSVEYSQILLLSDGYSLQFQVNVFVSVRLSLSNEIKNEF